ncbi:hypothetical protein Hte_009170 [Hypoxylon texense]
MDQGISPMDNVYHKLAAIDGNRASPPELIHTLAKAAMRDPEINNDIDQIYQRHQQMRAPVQTDPRQPAMLTQLPVSQPSAGSAIGYNLTPAYAQPNATLAQPVERARGPPLLTFNRPSADVQRGAKRQRVSESSEIPDGMTRSYSADRKEYSLIDIRSIKDPLPIPQCPRPPKSAAQLQIPPLQTQTRRSGSNAANPEADEEEEEEEEEEEPEPKENAADYSKVLEKVEKDLGWYGKYDKYSDARERTVGTAVAIRIRGVLEKMRGHMDKHRSFGNRAHVLTVMREILMAVLQTEGSRVGAEVRKSAYQYDDNLIWAVEKLTPAQRRKLQNLDGGAWVAEMRKLVGEANSYCIFERLPTVLSLLDPDAEDAEDATAAEPDDGVGDLEGDLEGDY